MALTPTKIYQELMNNNIDKKRAVDLLITIIENSEKDEVRLESMKLLEKIGIINDKIFKILENLMVSDLNQEVRAFATMYIKNYFLNKAISPIKWAIYHESDYECMILIIQTLVDLNNDESKSVLIDVLKQIKKTKYLNENKRIENKSFKIAIKKLLKGKKFKDLIPLDLAEIIINYLTISELTNKFYSVYFELKDSLVIGLDLSDVEYEVRGWKSDFKNNIKNISEIIGLENLKHLNSLNLSNNQIENIKGLTNIKSITHLFLNNNKIKDIKNLEYFRKMKNLKYLNLAGNPIVKNLSANDFKNIEVNLKKLYF